MIGHPVAVEVTDRVVEASVAVEIHSHGVGK